MIRYTRFYCFLLFFQFTSLFTYGQDPFFKRVSIPGVNSNFRVYSLCQDSRKVIWIGSSEGLFRFNGLIFEPVDLHPELLKSHVTAVAKLNNGGIVAGTRDGKLFTIVNGKFQISKPDTFLINTQISAIATDTANNIWFSTLGQGVYVQSMNNFRHITPEQGIGDNYVYDLVIDNYNTIWIGSDGGLSYSLQNNESAKFVNLNTTNGLPENIVRKISIGPASTIGIGMEELGFCTYDYSQNKFSRHNFFNDWNLGPVTGITLLKNEFWIGTPKSGIVDYEFRGKNRIRRFETHSEFSIKDISCMMTDHEGNIWIGAGSELYFSPGEKIEFKFLNGDEKPSNIRAILSDKNGNIWFSNESGVNFINNTDRSEEVIVQPLQKTIYNKSTVISFYEDVFGFIWMGTFDEGVLRFDPETVTLKHFGEKEGLTNLNVLSISGNKNEIWFATLGGAAKCELTGNSLDGVGNFVGYSEENGLGNNFIYKVFIDSKERIWFGTDGQGITCYSDGIFTNYDENDGLKSKVIYSITEDHSGNIWISSVNDGIYMFDGKSFKNFSFRHGLSDLNITALATDVNGNLIIVNKKGIDVLDPSNFQVLSYGSEAGLKDIDPNLNVIDVDLNGDVWAGIRNGILKISLEKKASAKMPIIVLDKVLSFLEPVDTTISNRFEFDKNHISFSYFSVWYLDPLRVNYQYKLEGYSSDWITTSDRIVTFPNLPPGSYTFQIKSSLNGNFELSEPTSYDFIVLRPFWQQPLFLAIASLFIIGIFYFYLQYRDRKIKAKESLNRERIASQFEVLRNQVNPHFLFNSFNTLVSIIEDDPNVAVEYVNKLSDFFRCILTYRDRDLITINEELEVAESYIFLQQKRYGKNFSVSIDIPDSKRATMQIPPLTLQLLLENCLKHNSASSETPLQCEIFMENEFLLVRNNVNRKLTNEPSTEIGLQNLRNRYKIITGNDIKIIQSNDFFTIKLPAIFIS